MGKGDIKTRKGKRFAKSKGQTYKWQKTPPAHFATDRWAAQHRSTTRRGCCAAKVPRGKPRDEMRCAHIWIRILSGHNPAAKSRRNGRRFLLLHPGRRSGRHSLCQCREQHPGHAGLSRAAAPHAVERRDIRGWAVIVRAA